MSTNKNLAALQRQQLRAAMRYYARTGRNERRAFWRDIVGKYRNATQPTNQQETRA